MPFGSLIDTSQRVDVRNTSYQNSFNTTWNRALTLGNLGDINLALGGNAGGGGGNWWGVAAAALVGVGLFLWIRKK